jgi:hypothetical protein
MDWRCGSSAVEAQSPEFTLQGEGVKKKLHKSFRIRFPICVKKSDVVSNGII